MITYEVYFKDNERPIMNGEPVNCITTPEIDARLDKYVKIRHFDSEVWSIVPWSSISWIYTKED